MKRFAVIRTDYPESTDIWEFDYKNEAKTLYDQVKHDVREKNSVMLVEVFESEDS